MSNNKNDEIGKIKYGELHYPIKIKKTLYMLHYYNIYGIIKKKLENYNLKWG